MNKLLLTVAFGLLSLCPSGGSIGEARTVVTTVKKVKKSHKKKRKNFLKVKATYYNPVAGQCYGDPTVTADNSKIQKDALKRGTVRWIAVSQDLLAEYPYGTKVRLSSTGYPEINGIYEIHDCMNPRFRYSIDILIHEDVSVSWNPHLLKMEKV